MGAGFHGGFGNTEGSKRQDKRESNSQYLPKNDAQIKHIFSGKEGNLKDTPSNRKLLTDLANNKEKFIGTDKYGNLWNAEINSDGKQNRVRYQNGTIN
jgi:putative RHS repeat-associated core domain protein